MAIAAAPFRASPQRPARVAEGQASLAVARRGLLTIGVMLATIMQILDTTIANVALPHMQTALGAQADTITWVLTSYIVASAIALPVTGWLSDRIGSRNLFLIAIAGFIVSSALCGAATGLGEMVAFRLLQGVSAAFMNPLSQTVLLDINPPGKQARAMSIWGMGIMIGPILGPVIGGWLTEYYNWRWVFYVNLPVGVICFAILWFLLPSRPKRQRKFDYLGFGLLALGLAAFQLLCDRGQGEDWFQSSEIWIEAGLAFIGIWMFGVHLATSKTPMFDREMFANRNLVTSLAFMLVIGVVMFATTALLPPMLESLFSYSVLDTGLLLMPRGVGVLVSMFVAGQLVQRGVDPRWMVGSGLVVAAASLWQMTQWTLVMDSSPFILSGLLQGLGIGLVFIPLQTMAFATLPAQYRTEGSSLLNLFRSIGASVGISVVTTVLARNSQIAHQDVGSNVTSSALDGVTAAMVQTLGATGDSALALLNAEVSRQAAMIAYLDDFWLMMALTALTVPLVLFLKRPKGPIEAAGADAAGH